jgi:hypothetical protein
MAQAEGKINFSKLTEEAFQKCAPYLEPNVKQCGSVTLCQAKPMTTADLGAYLKSGDYRVMDAILKNDMEIRQCEAVQNGLYDFLMASKVNMSRKLTVTQRNAGLREIAPFVKAKQYSPINNEYWKIVASANNWVQTGGTKESPQTCNLTIESTSSIPADIRSFPEGMYIYVEAKGPGGTSAKGMAMVYDRQINSSNPNRIDLIVRPQSSASFLRDVNRINGGASNIKAPSAGLVRRGTPNVNDFESWCNEAPAYINWRHVPFWIQTSRHSMCKSSMYDQWRSLLLESNPLYREFGDLDDIEKNKQLGADWQRRWVNSVFFNPPLEKQNLGEYDQLDDIETADPSSDLGVDKGKCVGKRANAVGIYEQLAECDRVIDLLGDTLNLPALFQELYNILRVREGTGNKSDSIDLFTDSVTAERFNQAMIRYYNAKSDNTLRMTIDVAASPYSNQDVKKGPFGFNYRSYRLFWPACTINIISHYFFDDYVTAAKVGFGGEESDEDYGRVLWILDFSGIYPGIISSNRVAHKTGNLRTMAEVDSSWACVMRVHTQTQTLTSLTYTVVVECPYANLILENFNGDIPSHVPQGVDYSSHGNEGQVATTTSAAG